MENRKDIQRICRQLHESLRAALEVYLQKVQRQAHSTRTKDPHAS